MSPLRWTSDKPTAPGWYWYRGAHTSNRAEVVSVGEMLQGRPLHAWFNETDMENYSVEELDGQFAGPIQEPT